MSCVHFVLSLCTGRLDYCAPYRVGLDMCVAVHLIRESDLECKCL